MKVAIYIRLSKEDVKKIMLGDDSESIKNQKLMLEDYAQKRNWEIYDYYIDEDYSGADRERPEFDRLLKDAENKKFSVIICKQQNRFARDLEIIEKIIHGKFLEWGIRFITVLDGADTSNTANKKSRQIHGMVDEWYLEDLSKNIREVFKVKMKNGQYLGAFAPYGYVKNPENRHQLIIDEAAAEVVRRIFSLYLQGFGTHTIAQILSKEGVPRPNEHIKKNTGNFYIPNVGKYDLWSHTTINRILRNPVYIGTLVQGKESTLSYKNKKRVKIDQDNWVVRENAHDPIISKKDFLEVQKLLDNKRRKGNTGKTHIFATKVRCLHCGGTMVRCSTRKESSDHRYAYLKCKNNTLAGDLICEKRNRISYNDLYHFIEGEFVNIMNIYKNYEEATEATLNKIKRVDYQKEIKKFRRNIQEIDSQLLEKDRILVSLYKDKVENKISESDFFSISDFLKQEKEQLGRRKSELEKTIDEYKALEDVATNVENIFQKYLENQKLTHELVVETIDYIEIGSLEEDGTRKINVYWKI